MTFPAHNDPRLPFPAVGGECETILEAIDWIDHPLGDPIGWPEPLKAAVRIVLSSGFPMMVHWGPELFTFYNDAYAPSLGRKHPGHLGQPAREWWSEMWDQLTPVFDQVLAGKTVFIEDARYTPDRDGAPKEAFFTHSHSPLWDVDGRVAGIFLVVTETTRRVLAEQGRQADDLRNRQIMDSATDFAMIATDLDGIVTRWTKGAEKVLGWTEEEMLGHHVDRIFTDEDRAEGRPAVEMRCALDTGASNDERWHIKKSGQRFWAQGKLTLVRAESGAIAGFVKVLRDRTTERLAEAKLHETEERLRLANGATNDAIWDWDLVGNHVTWNEAIERGYGHRLSEVEPTGEWWINHIHPEDRARIDDSIHGVIDGGTTDWSDEYRFRRADGSYADIRDRGFVLRDEAGKPLRMIGAMLDQSERMNTERQLRHEAVDLADQVKVSVAELERLWNASPDLIVVGSLEGVYIRANPAWMTILGYEEDEVIGRSAANLIHPGDAAPTARALAIAQVGELPPYVCRFRHKDGSYRWISWAAAPDRGEIFAIGRDVTAAREADEVLRHTEDALRQSQKVEAVGQLTGGVAHDFNNLLTVIRGSVDLLRRPGLSDEKRIRYVDAIADTADRATKLTAQLLAFARRQTLQPQVFDAGASIAALQGMLPTLTGSRIETRYDLPEQSASVLADPSQFDTAIVNMAVNARDAMDGEGSLAITVAVVAELPALRNHPAVREPHVAVSIADTGSGIPADRIEQIFEPFFTTKGVGHGTGLGLSQVFGFAKQSGGDVAVDSELGRGTTFILYLPLVSTEQPTTATDRPYVQPIEAGKCILVVEDNREVGEFATQALAELGLGSHWVADADAAIAELEHSTGRYDVVFTDVVMPGRSGIELAEEVRQRYPSLPVVLTSGYSHVLAQEGTRGLQLLRKPYSIEELADILAQAIAQD